MPDTITGIKYLNVDNRNNGYTYYLVDIRKKGYRFKKYFPLNLDGALKATEYINECIDFINGIE